MPGRIIQQQQDLLPRQVVTPDCGPGLQARRDLRRADPGHQQQTGQRIRRIHRPLPGRVAVQRQEHLPIGEPWRELVRGMHREGGLCRSPPSR